MAKKKSAVEDAKKSAPKASPKKEAPEAKSTKKTVVAKKTAAKKVVTEKPVESKPAKSKSTETKKQVSKTSTAKKKAEKPVAQESAKKNATKKAAVKVKTTAPEAKEAPEEIEETVQSPSEAKASKKAKRRELVKNLPKQKLDATMVKGGVKLTSEKMEQLKQMLLEKLKEVEGDVPSLMAEGLGSSTQNSNSPLHFAELGTDTFNQNFALGRLEREEVLLGWVYEALDKMANGKFGTCSECGDLLRLARLEFTPWVPNCVECQEKLESNYSQD